MGMIVEGPNGPEQREVASVMNYGRGMPRYEPELRDGEEVFHCVSGRCVVVPTGRRSREVRVDPPVSEFGRDY